MTGWEVRCNRCGSSSRADLAKVRRPRDTPLHLLEGRALLKGMLAFKKWKQRTAAVGLPSDTPPDAEAPERTLPRRFLTLLANGRSCESGVASAVLAQSGRNSPNSRRGRYRYRVKPGSEAQARLAIRIAERPAMVNREDQEEARDDIGIVGDYVGITSALLVNRGDPSCRKPL
jgi:hypothetical protein